MLNANSSAANCLARSMCFSFWLLGPAVRNGICRCRMQMALLSGPRENVEKLIFVNPIHHLCQRSSPFCVCFVLFHFVFSLKNQKRPSYWTPANLSQKSHFGSNYFKPFGCFYDNRIFCQKSDHKKSKPHQTHFACQRMWSCDCVKYTDSTDPSLCSSYSCMFQQDVGKPCQRGHRAQPQYRDHCFHPV